MITGSKTRGELASHEGASVGRRKGRRFVTLVAGLILVAAIVASAMAVLGGGQTYQVGDVPPLTGDRDTAWIESLERQADAKKTADQSGAHIPGQPWPSQP